MNRLVHLKCIARLDKAMNQETVISIDRHHQIVHVRGKGCRTRWSLPLATVASMIVARVARAEAAKD